VFKQTNKKSYEKREKTVRKMTKCPKIRGITVTERPKTAKTGRWRLIKGIKREKWPKPQRNSFCMAVVVVLYSRGEDLSSFKVRGVRGPSTTQNAGSLFFVVESTLLTRHFLCDWSCPVKRIICWRYLGLYFGHKYFKH
jgi:hypothetical protein